MIRHIRAAQALFLLFAMALLTGCAALGVPTPETFNQKAAVAIGTVTQVRQSATMLLQAKKISVADAENVLKQTDNAAEAITVARAINATDPGAADSKLSAVVSILTVLQQYLATKGG